MERVIKATRKRFSFGWSRFAKDEVSKDWYKDSFSYLSFIPSEIFSGEDKVGLDAGCGSGSDMLHISKYGARIIGIDISDSIKITGGNISLSPRLGVVQANIYDLPFRDETFDFAYSFGVLHHLPDPEAGFKILCSKVKRGGAVIVYLYEDFSERPSLDRALLKAVNSMRMITPKLPPRLLHFLCVIMSPLVFLFCSLPYAILKNIPATKKAAERIPFRHTMRLDCIVSDLYDRFSPPVERRYNRSQVASWFESAGFYDVQIKNYRGWVAWGRRR